MNKKERQSGTENKFMATKEERKDRKDKLGIQH